MRTVLPDSSLSLKEGQQEWQNTIDNMIYDLFAIVKIFALSAGGDGSVSIVSNNYRSLADRFEKYEKETDNHFTERFNGNESVAFIHEQEYINFSLTEHTNLDEMVIKLPDYW